MTKEELNQKIEQAKMETKEALLTLYNILNQEQQQKILKDEKIKELFTRYYIDVTE